MPLMSTQDGDLSSKVKPIQPPPWQVHLDAMWMKLNGNTPWTKDDIRTMCEKGVPIEEIVDALCQCNQDLHSVQSRLADKHAALQDATQRRQRMTRRGVLGLLGLGTIGIGVGAVMRARPDCLVAIRYPHGMIYKEHETLRELLGNKNLCETLQRATVEIRTYTKRAMAYIVSPNILLSSAHLFYDDHNISDARIRFISGVNDTHRGDVIKETFFVGSDDSDYASACDKERDLAVIVFDHDIFPANVGLPFATDAELTGVALKSNTNWYINGGALTSTDEDGSHMYMHAETVPGSSGGTVVTRDGHFIGLAVSDERTPQGVLTTKIVRVRPTILYDLYTVAVDRLQSNR